MFASSQLVLYVKANFYALAAIALWALLAAIGVALHIVAALTGFTGAAIAILGAGGSAGTGGWYWGYLPAMTSAFIWASYSIMTKRVRAFPTPAIGLLGLVSGLLSLLCHALLEPATTLSAQDWLLLVLLGLGPLGAAFFCGTRPSNSATRAR